MNDTKCAILTIVGVSCRGINDVRKYIISTIPEIFSARDGNCTHPSTPGPPTARCVWGRRGLTVQHRISALASLSLLPSRFAMLWPVPEGHCFSRLNKIPVWGPTTFTEGHSSFLLQATGASLPSPPADTCPSCWFQVSEGCTWEWSSWELLAAAEPSSIRRIIIPPSRNLENIPQNSFPCAVVWGLYLFSVYLISPSR